MDKRPNIKTVAGLAGVSISTVSRVLNHADTVSDELKERVYRAIEDTRYSVNPIASTLKSAKRNQIAIVMPSLRQTYYTDIIKGISDYCYGRQVMASIMETSGEFGKEKRIIDDLEKQWVDGIIVIPSKNTHEEQYREYMDSLNNLSKKGKKIPVVLMETEDSYDGVDCVRVDYRYAFYGLACHLLEIGRRHIAYLGCPPDAPMQDSCMEGFRKALGEYGCRQGEEYLANGGYTVLDGYNAMEALFERGPVIDGVVCANDQVASGALQACNERSIPIPQSIAIAGFGGVALSIVTTPSISTMIAPRYKLGSTAAKLLFERIDGYHEESRTVVLKPHLAIRGSTLKSAVKKLDMMFAE